MTPKQEPVDDNHVPTAKEQIDDRRSLSCWGLTDDTPPGYNVDEALQDAVKIKRVVPAENPKDRELILKCCCLKQWPLSENWLWDALEGVRKTPTRSTPMAKFWTNCENGARDMGENFRQLLKTMVLPPELVAKIHENGKPASQHKRQRA